MDSSYNFGGAGFFYQLRVPFFLLFVLLLGGGGCREAEAPGYERLEAQLVQDAFESLAAGRSAQASRVLERLAVGAPDEEFYRLAVAREHERQRMLRLNVYLARGQLGPALKFLRDEAARNGSSPALVEAETVVTALTALRSYVGALPFPDSDTAQAALGRLTEVQAPLVASRHFQVWLTGQRRQLEVLRERERSAVLRQLAAAFDMAVISGVPDPGLILAQIAAVAPEHPLLTLVNGDVSKLSTSAWSGAAVEIAACFAWPALSGVDRCRLRTVLASRSAGSFCGSLLRVLLAEGSAGAVGIRRIQGLAALMPLDPSWAGELLEAAVLPRAQFSAGCWRAPFPSVADYLNRVAQMRSVKLSKEKNYD